MKRSSKVFTFLFCAFAVFFVGISTASADRIYSLEDPRVSWDSSSSHCSVNGQAGTKVSNSATQGRPSWSLSTPPIRLRRTIIASTVAIRAMKPKDRI